MSNLKGCFSHNTDDWRTPSYLYSYFVHQCACVDLFPYKSKYDQYGVDYYNEKLFCNPPYSELNKVADYLIKQILNGCEIILLIPSRTDTLYFHKLFEYCYHIKFIKGRLKFNDSKLCAPFPSILMFLKRDHKDCICSVI